MPNNNEILNPDSRSALQKLKMETAQELGIQNYDSADKGTMSSRMNGAVGGYMVRKLVALAQKELTNKG